MRIIDHYLRLSSAILFAVVRPNSNFLLSILIDIQTKSFKLKQYRNYSNKFQVLIIKIGKQQHRSRHLSQLKLNMPSQIRMESDHGKLENILKHKDTTSSNLNSRFESYGCNTLEFKVPVVSEPIIQQLKGSNHNKQLLETYRLKQKAASGALRGQRPRTRNAQLRLVEFNGETVITATEGRERSPVERDTLDDDIDEYMKERERIKKARQEDDTQRIISALSMDDEDEVGDDEDNIMFP